MEFGLTFVQEFSVADKRLQFTFSPDLLADTSDLHNLNVPFDDIQSAEFCLKRHGEFWRIKTKAEELSVVKWDCPSRAWQTFCENLDQAMQSAGIRILGPGFSAGFERLAYLGLACFLVPPLAFFALRKMADPLWAWAALGLGWFLSLMFSMMSREYHSISRTLWPVVLALGLILTGLVYFGVIDTGI